MTHADKTQEIQKKSVTNEVSQRHNREDSTFQFVDNRPEAIAQRKLQEIINNSPQVKQITQLQSMANNKSQEKVITPFVKPTTISPLIIGGGLVLGAAAAIYARKRRSGINVTLELHPAEIVKERLHAGVAVQATGLQKGDWVDYQIRWAQGAVPGFNGVNVVNPHLGQQVGQAGGWKTDEPPQGNPSPLRRNPDNPRYQDQGDGTANFTFIDDIEQSVNMPHGNANDRRWWFRAIVRNSWGIPIKTSNTIIVQWP
jgi:hypothetical protein